MLPNTNSSKAMLTYPDKGEHMGGKWHTKWLLQDWLIIREAGHLETFQ